MGGSARSAIYSGGRLRLVAPQAAASPAGTARGIAAIDRRRSTDPSPEPGFGEIVALAATICNAPFAAISFVAADLQRLNAEFGFGAREAATAQAFDAHAMEQRATVVITDLRRHAEFAGSPLVTGEPHLRFHAGVPLFAGDGTPIAALCVFDRAARPQGLSATERTTLEVLARQVETQLELRRAISERELHVGEQHRMSEGLPWAAAHDALTGLPNRALFQVRLRAAVDRAHATGGRAALLLFDIDHFKQVNDTSGHDAGDTVLQSCADRLRSAAGPADTVARQGGDEFAMIVDDAGDDAALAGRIADVLGRLRAPLWLGDRMVDCRASVGVAVYPDDAATPATVIKCADLALAVAKTGGRDRAVRFLPGMRDDQRRRAAMLRLARGALERDQIVPHYQPKIHLRTGLLTGFEALLRWHQPDAVMLPATIESAFSDRDVSIALSRRMLTQILTDMRLWLDTGLGFGHVAINSSAVDFVGDDFAESLLHACAEARVPPRLIELEITESVFLGRGSHHVQRALTTLRRHGVRIALDDFGTGLASLVHLRQFRVDVLKIDQSFIAGLGTSRDDAAIVRAAIMLGHGLVIETVAEGVETVAQADYVRAKGCTVGQGFLFGGASPANDVPAVIARHGLTPH